MFQTLPEASAVHNVPDTVNDSVLAVERTVLVLVRRGRRLALHDVAALHVAGEQRRSHLGHETVRQVSVIFFFFLAHKRTRPFGRERHRFFFWQYNFKSANTFPY